MPINPDIDELVPDPQVRRELGGQSEMTTHRWDKSAEMAELGWPPPIRLNGRKYRSRKALDQFRANCVNRAIAERNAAIKPGARRSEPVA